MKRGALGDPAPSGRAYSYSVPLEPEAKAAAMKALRDMIRAEREAEARRMLTGEACIDYVAGDVEWPPINYGEERPE